MKANTAWLLTALVCVAACSSTATGPAAEPATDPCDNVGRLPEGESLDVQTQAKSAAARCAEHGNKADQ